MMYPSGKKIKKGKKIVNMIHHTCLLLLLAVWGPLLRSARCALSLVVGRGIGK